MSVIFAVPETYTTRVTSFTITNVLTVYIENAVLLQNEVMISYVKHNS